MDLGENEKLKHFQSLVVHELDALEESIERSLQCETPLIESICKHLREGRGKRIRPTVLFLAARSAGSPNGNLVPAGLAVELIHTATLIHDDILDEHFFRRGKPTVYAKWGGKAATIIGDFLYTKAFSILADEGLFELMDILAKVTNTICIGEIIQLEQRRNLHMSEDGYIDVIDKKTASLFSASCECGAILGGEKNGHRRLYSGFGKNVGMAFQITDDIFDYIGNEDEIGKPVASDFSDGRITLPFITAFNNAPEEARGRVKELLMSGFNGDSWGEIVSFVRNYGGVEYSIKRARDFGSRAKSYLENISPSVERDALSVAVDYVVERVSGL